MSRIDAYLDAIYLAMRDAGDFQPSPFHIAEVAPYFLDIEALDLHARLRQLASELSDRELASLFPGANSMKTLLMDLVCGMKMVSLPASERVWFVERIFDAMAAAETGDIFCRDGTHRLLAAEEAQQLASAPGWQPVDNTGPRSLGRAAYRASACGQAMVWSLYFYAWTDMGWEIHGPYEVQSSDDKPRLLLVRDYFDLAPSLLWPEIGHWPMRSMRLMTLHDTAAEIRIDVLNHALQNGSWLESTRGIQLSVDGAPVEGEGMAAVASRLLDAARDHQQIVSRMTRPELLKKFCASRYYAFRRWRTWFGDDWQPPADVERRIDQHPFGMGPEAETDDLDLLRQAFDPRTEVIN
jgi:hypothetical protein